MKKEIKQKEHAHNIKDQAQKFKHDRVEEGKKQKAAMAKAEAEQEK